MGGWGGGGLGLRHLGGWGWRSSQFTGFGNKIQGLGGSRACFLVLHMWDEHAVQKASHGV